MLGIHRIKKINEFMLDSFKENYLPARPVRALLEAYHSIENGTCTKIDKVLTIGPYLPGDRLRQVKKELKVIHSHQYRPSPEHQVDLMLGLDEVSDILRITVATFLNYKLVSLKNHFPFIGLDEIVYLKDLLHEKYLNGTGVVPEDITYVKGTNSVALILDTNISITYQFIDASNQNINLIKSLSQRILREEEDEIMASRKRILETL